MKREGDGPMRNYLEKRTRLRGFRRHFAYFDDENFSSESLLYRNRVRIRIEVVVRKKDSKYLVVFCTVRRQDAERFIRAMEELKNKMLLIGNTDYEAFCRRFIPQPRKA